MSGKVWFRVCLLVLVAPVAWLAHRDPFLILQPKVIFGLAVLSAVIPAALQIWPRLRNGGAIGGDVAWTDETVD